VASELAERRCVPCREGAAPLEGEALEALHDELGGGWRVLEGHHLEKEYRFPDFREALAFTNRVGELAEEQDHHPEILLSWGRVALRIWTHAVGGLSENDFVLAARADRLFQAR
jgi:4a-hydroxytetrahydrobiopterin dehydratase